LEGNLILLFLVLFPMCGAIVSYLIGRKSKTGRDYFAAFVAIVEFLIFAYLFATFDGTKEFVWNGFCYMGLKLQLDGFRVIYGSIAALMWMMTTLLSKEYFLHYRNRNRYYLFTLLTLGATVGVFLSRDLYTTFIFFEIMSFTSYVWVAHDEKERTLRAAGTYLAVAVIGGLVMLMGLFLLYNELGTLEISQLLAASEAVQDKTVLYVAGGCLLFGFGAKAGMYPLHIWLPKAHPVAPAPASALLSGILTKCGIFGVLVVSCQIFLHDEAWGKVILFLGVITMFLGAFLALFSINIKRTLALSSVSQIGFILVGVGMQGILGHHNALAVQGTFLHMMNHSLFKLVLFMIAGVIMMNLHKLDLNEIRGFGRKKPLLMFDFAMGALGIMGIPFWSGYVSKTLLHESIVEYIEILEHSGFHSDVVTYKTVEWIFLISGGFTIAYMLKLFIAVFVEKNPTHQQKMDEKKKYMTPVSAFAITVPAVMLPVFGIVPTKTMNRLANMARDFMHGELPAHDVHYFAFTNVKGALVSIVIGVFVYFAFIRLLLMKKDENGNKVYINAWPDWLDLEDLVYRPILMRLLPFIGAFVSRCFEWVTDGLVIVLGKTVLSPVKEKGPIVGTKFTYACGTIADSFVELMNKTFYKNNPKETDYVTKFAKYYEEVSRTGVLIRRSLSFGLLMFCIGLVITLIYLLF